MQTRDNRYFHTTTRISCALALAAALALGSAAQAGTYYWDTNGTTLGFGTAGGIWGTDADWNTDSTGGAGGTIDNATITTADDVIFGTALDGLGAGTVSGPSAAQGFLNMTFGSASGSISLSGGNLTLDTTTGSTITVNNTSDTVSTVLQGVGGKLIKDGSGTLTLAGNASTYSGATTIKAGTLVAGTVNGQTGISSSSSVLLGDTTGIANATLQLGNSTSTNYSNNVRIQSGNSGLLALNGSGFINLSGTVTLGTDGSTGKSVTIANVGSSSAWIYDLQGVIQDPASMTSGTAGTVTVGSTGTGTVRFSAANTYTGDTRLAANSFTINNANALQNSTLDLATGDTGTVSAINQNSTLGGLKGTRNLNMQTRTLSIGNNNQDTSYSGVLSNGALTKIGSGTLTLNGTNTYAGATTISAGTLKIGNSSALGTTAAGTTVSSGATLDIGGNFNLGTEVVTISGTGVGGNGAIINSGVEAGTAFGRIVLGANATVGGSGRWDLRNSTPTLNMAGYTLTKTGANQIVFVGVAVSNPGNIVINQGTIALQLGTNLGGNSSNSVTINNGGILSMYQSTSAHAWTLNLNDGSTLFAENSNAGTQNKWAGAVNVTGTAAMQVDPGFVMTIDGGISGGGNITKTGNGTLTLTGTNGYSGATLVTAGTLVVSGSGSINASSNVTVATGSTLTNSSAAALTPALGLSEGAKLTGTGSFMPSALTILGDLTGGSFTSITVNSTLTKTGSLAFTLTNVVDGSYNLFGGTTTPGGSFSSVSVGGNPLAETGPGSGIFSANVGGVDYTFTDASNLLVVAVPEPATWALVGVGLTFALYRKRFARAFGRRNEA